MPNIFTRGLSTNTRRWCDLDLDFNSHPITKDIVTEALDALEMSTFFLMKFYIEEGMSSNVFQKSST